MSGGLYNVVFGRRRETSVVTLILLMESGYGPGDVGLEMFGRLRDAWVEETEDGGLEIRVHTRNGGLNRRDHVEAILAMRAHPWFDRDLDLEYDSTYADFYFKIPQAAIDAAPTFREIAGPRLDVNAAWAEAIRRLESGDGIEDMLAKMDEHMLAVTGDETMTPTELMRRMGSDGGEATGGVD